MGHHSDKGTEISPYRLAVWMGRAFSPQERRPFHTWGVAPGWYGSGLRPSGNGANGESPSQNAKKSAEGADHISLGQRPRNCRNEKRTRAVGPFHHLKCINSSRRLEKPPHMVLLLPLPSPDSNLLNSEFFVLHPPANALRSCFLHCSSSPAGICPPVRAVT